MANSAIKCYSIPKIIFKAMSQHPKNGISEADLEAIASMHISPRKSASGIKRPAAKFRFFLDKLRHFYEFDPGSIILQRDDDGTISGVLIYTYSERAFNEFSGPRHMRFYVKAIKTIFGLYGFQFRKFFLAAKSMLGLGGKIAISSGSVDFAKIWVLIVAEEERRKGIASKLLRECLAQLKTRGVEIVRVTVKKDNIPAIKGYEKQGFKTVGGCTESSGASYIMERSV